MHSSTADTRLPALVSHIGISGRGLALVAGFLALLMRPALFDPDYYWHIETGRLIVAQWAVPRTDPFSFTAANQAWVAHEWLFEAFLYLVFAAAGSFGVKLMTALFGIASVVLVYATANRVLAQPTRAAWLAAAFYPFVYEFPSPRPQLLTYVFLAAYLYVLVAFKYARSVRLLPALPLLMLLWVNAHGGYVIGALLVAVFCLSEWLVLHGALEDRRRLQRLAVMAGLVILASLCNPDFIAHWAYPFYVMGMKATQDIPEWRSPDFRGSLGRMYLLLTAGFCALQIYRVRKPDVTELGVPALFIAAGFSSNRHVLLAAMAMTIFAAPALRDGLQIAPALRAALERLQGKWRRHASRGKPLGRAEGLLNLAVAFALVLVATVYYPTASLSEAAFVRQRLPVDAAQFVLDKGVSGRMFNAYGFGGYLIHALYPQQRVFIDGRSDMYGDSFFAEYGAIENGAAGWAALFDKYAIDYVVCEHDAPIRQLLLTRGDFRLVFDDSTSSVLVRNATRFARIPTIE